MSADFDVQGLQQVSRSLTLAGRKSKTRAAAIVKKAAVNIKNQMRDEAQHVEAGRISSTINFEIKSDGGGITAEIGPQEGHAGSLAFFYFGNSKIGPRIPDPMGALDAEIPNLKSYLSKLVDL